MSNRAKLLEEAAAEADMIDEDRIGGTRPRRANAARHWPVLLGALVGSAATLVPSIALADGAGSAAAEVLFQEGRDLFQEGRYAEACPKLAESHRVDPATGTQLALALCHEGEGKFASAWAEFKDVEARSRQEGRKDREELARDRAQALEPRLSTLAVDVPAEVAEIAGLEVKVDGALTGAAAFGVAVPIDGGEHRIEATAPGKAPWHTVVSVKGESDAVRVNVPALAEAPAEPAAPAPVAAPPPLGASEPRLDTPSSGGSWPPLRTAALITAGAGVVAMGVGGFLAMDAKSSYDGAKKRCSGSVCPDQPYETIQDAQGQGNVATILFAVGGAAVAAGAVLWFVAPSSSAEKRAARAPAVRRVGVALHGLVVSGDF